MAALKRILILLGMVISCVVIVFVGGFLLGAAGKAVCLIAFVPAFAIYLTSRRSRRYHVAAFGFALAMAAGFGLWLTEN
ncbi:MAG: hypothetical protein WD534_14150 [Phycisphaeraceae bacterium]